MLTGGTDFRGGYDRVLGHAPVTDGHEHVLITKGLGSYEEVIEVDLLTPFMGEPILPQLIVAEPGCLITLKVLGNLSQSIIDITHIDTVEGIHIL